MSDPAIDADATSPSNTSAAEDSTDDDVWLSFEQSVAYMRNLSALYKDAFLSPATAKSTASKTHVEAAKGHTREAIELLASNVLNASAAIVAEMDSQDEKMAALNDKLHRVKERLHERKAARDERVIRQFYDVARGSEEQHGDEHIDTTAAGTLKLSLARQSLVPTAPSSSASTYLYL